MTYEARASVPSEGGAPRYHDFNAILSANSQKKNKENEANESRVTHNYPEWHR